VSCEFVLCEDSVGEFEMPHVVCDVYILLAVSHTYSSDVGMISE